MKTKEQVSYNMKRVKNKDTQIEILLRKALYSEGFRYRKNYKDLPGKPDIALTKYKIAIFCDSEFWHGYDWKNRKSDFKSNRDFWIPKIERNIERDAEVNRELKTLGWKVVRFWGRDILNNTKGCVNTIKELVFDIKMGEE